RSGGGSGGAGGQGISSGAPVVGRGAHCGSNKNRYQQPSAILRCPGPERHASAPRPWHHRPSILSKPGIHREGGIMDTYQALISTLALTMGVGWASGVNLYAAVFVLGLAGATGNLTLPEGLQVLQDPLVIGAAGVMYFVEFFADKTPGVDSGWDGLHTFIRIPAGALLAAGAVGDVTPALEAAAGLLGGTMATASHFTKASTRLLINTSPEPFSNWVASISEDLLVLGALWTMFNHPFLFVGLMVLFIALVLWLLPRLWRLIRAAARKVGTWLGIVKAPEPEAPPPGPPAAPPVAPRLDRPCRPSRANPRASSPSMPWRAASTPAMNCGTACGSATAWMAKPSMRCSTPSRRTACSATGASPRALPAPGRGAARGRCASATTCGAGAWRRPWWTRPSPPSMWTGTDSPPISWPGDLARRPRRITPKRPAACAFSSSGGSATTRSARPSMASNDAGAAFPLIAPR